MTIYHPITTQIVHILREKGVWYETFEHEPVVTSEDAAKVRTGYTLSQGAKALIVSYKPQVQSSKMKTASEKSYVMLVLPGDRKLDNKKVKDILGTKSYSFADPDELARVTSGVERSAIPAMGPQMSNMYRPDSEEKSCIV
jgi:Ala-tRNA(Pro) deacylase